MSELDLDMIRAAVTASDAGALEDREQLAKMHITGFSEDGHELLSRELLGDMLVFELPLDGEEYIKLGKKWCRILDEMRSFITTEIAGIPVDLNLLPEWDKSAHGTENEYNRFVAADKGWTCLDAQFVHIEGQSKIELCDLFDLQNKRFIHVKNTWGSKSAYLFTQGVTSAETYRQSRQFRQKCAAQWPALFSEEIRDATVIFGIAAEEMDTANFPSNMTYFAKLNLYNAVSLLRQYGYRVRLAPVRIVGGAPGALVPQGVAIT